MSQSSWSKFRWSFSNIFKRFLSFFTSSTCLMSYLILCLKIVWWYYSCGKLTFLQLYTRDNVDYATMSFSFWQRSTLESFMLALCGSMVQCLAARVTSLTIINFCSEGIIYKPSSIEMIIQINLRVERILNFNSWYMHCTPLLLRR